jgi:hypothetical protein
MNTPFTRPAPTPHRVHRAHRARYALHALACCVLIASVLPLAACSRSSSAGLEYGNALGRVGTQKKLADSMWADVSKRIDAGEQPDPREIRDVANFAMKARDALGLLTVNVAERSSVSADTKAALNDLDAAASKAALAR